MDAKLIARFWKRVDKRGPRECWPFLLASGEESPSYGKLFWGDAASRGQLLAHRLSWQIHNGPIPPGLHVRHRCDNPPCCNPAHLMLGTHKDNMRDMVERGRAVYLKGEEAGRAILTEQQVTEIRARYVTVRQLAREYGVSRRTIRSVLHRVNWRHV